VVKKTRVAGIDDVVAKRPSQLAFLSLSSSDLIVRTHDRDIGRRKNNGERSARAAKP